MTPAAGQLAARSNTVVELQLSGAAEKELIELLKLEVRCQESAPLLQPRPA